MLCYTNSTSIVISTSGKLLKVFRINVFCILFYFTMMYNFSQDLDRKAWKITFFELIHLLFYFILLQ